MNRLVEFITDPSTNKLSASRLCLLVIVLIFWPTTAILELTGHKLGIWPQLVGLTLAVCGVYGVSTYTSGNFGIQNFLGTQSRVDIPKGG